MAKLAFRRTRSPIGGQVGSVEVAGVVAGGTDVGAPRLLTVKRSAWSIAPARDLVEAREAGEDRQAGGVGGRPAVRAHRFERRFQIAPEPAFQPAAPASRAKSS